MDSIFLTEVMGLNKENPNGTNRRSILYARRLGETLELAHKPIPPDKNAIMVLTQSGEQLGWLKRDIAAKLAPIIDNNVAVTATVIQCGQKPKPFCELKIEIDPRYIDALEEKRYLKKAVAAQVYAESLENVKQVQKSYIKWSLKIAGIIGLVFLIIFIATCLLAD